MAEFIDFEASIADDIIMVSDDESVGGGDQICNNFIDNDNVVENESSFYRAVDQQLENIGDIDEILEEELEQSFADAENLDMQNLCHSDEEIEPEVNFSSSEKRLKAFKETFFLLDNENLSFKGAILYAIRFDQTRKTCKTTTEFNTEIAANISAELRIELDLRKFNTSCFELTDMLMQDGYFLLVFELRSKFREVRLKTVTKKKLIRELSSCIKIKFDGFEIVSVQCQRELRKKFTPIDVIYKPVLRKNDPINCFVSCDISKCYYSVCSNNSNKEIARTGYAYNCYYCQKFFVRQDRFKKHVENCSGIPGIVYNFHTQNLITFKDNLKNKGDLPMTFYFDLETTAPTDSCYDPEQKEMFVVSYVIIIAFHPDLKMKKIICERPYGHSLKQLSTIDYFSEDQTLKQLKDVAHLVSLRKRKKSMGQMLSIEMLLLKETLGAWFNKKIKSNNLSIKPLNKINYEQNNPVDSSQQKCVLCNFKLDITPTSVQTPDLEMTYGDFYIRQEHKFIRNIYTLKELSQCDEIKTLSAYYDGYQKLIDICVCLQNVWTAGSFDDFNILTKNFVQNECENNFTITKLKDNINETEVKNLTRSKIPARLLKVIAYVYQNLIFFPCHKFEFETAVSAHFFRNLYRLLKCKIHLHHSHLMGKIEGYVHDFCNWTVRENKTELSVIAHNLFGFDAFYFLKGFQASVWGTKNISVGSNRLTSINYMNINGGEVKFIDTLKYYQTSLAGLTKTATAEEKNAVKKLCEEFLLQHDYFSQVRKFWGPVQKEKILEIVSGGKGIIPYEMILDMNSLDVKPVGEFYDKEQFFSELKMKRVCDEDYLHSKYLFKTLKMQKLSVMNDLHNFQDVALLCELVENRFQAMQNKSGYNPRKCNSASTLSGCIEREMSKVIIALPTNNEYINLFEQTLTGGFSCVNTRLAFDTKILLPNHKNSKDQNYKVCYGLKFDDDVEQQKSRVISKILKLDENNQYGFAMTKPMATGCIKDDNDLSWRTFNFLLESVTLDDPIGHLYVVVHL